MASPQKEDGYTAIANEIMEAFGRYRIPGEQRQVLDVILRKTYGFNKKWDAIAGSQLVKATGINKQNMHRALNALVEKNIVIKKDDGNIVKYCFNKNYKTWKPSSKKMTLPRASSKKMTSVIKKDDRSSSKKTDTKVDITKVDITKEKNSSSNDFDVGHFDLFWEAYPRKVGKQECLKIWLNPKKKEIRPSIEELVRALKIQKQSEDWTKENGRYIPHPSTWLNQGRWDDELRMPQETPGGDLKPKTYAQAQDAERRTMVKMLKEIQNDGKSESDSGGTSKTTHLLSHGKEID